MAKKIITDWKVNARHCWGPQSKLAPKSSSTNISTHLIPMINLTEGVNQVCDFFHPPKSIPADRPPIQKRRSLWTGMYNEQISQAGSPKAACILLNYRRLKPLMWAFLYGPSQTSNPWKHRRWPPFILLWVETLGKMRQKNGHSHSKKVLHFVLILYNF